MTILVARANLHTQVNALRNDFYGVANIQALYVLTSYSAVNHLVVFAN